MSGHEAERLSAYLDRELAPPERAAVEAHLAGCAECARRLEQLVSVDALAAGLDAQAPEGYFDDFAARVRARISGSAPRRRRHRAVPGWTWAVAAVLLLAVVTPLTLRQPTRRPGTSEQEPATEAKQQVPARADFQAAAPAGVERAAPVLPAPRRVPAGTPGAPRAEASLPRAERQPEERIFAAAPPPAPMAALPPSATAARVADADEAAAPAVAEPSLAPAPEEAVGEAGFAGGSRERQKAVSSDRGSTRLAAGRASAAGSLEALEPVFQRLDGRRPQTLSEWRANREAWRAFAETSPSSPHADEARVRAIEAGSEVVRLGGSEQDRAALRRDLSEYLARDDAPQKARVRRYLDLLMQKPAVSEPRLPPAP